MVSLQAVSHRRTSARQSNHFLGARSSTTVRTIKNQRIRAARSSCLWGSVLLAATVGSSLIVGVFLLNHRVWKESLVKNQAVNLENPVVSSVETDHHRVEEAQPEVDARDENQSRESSDNNVLTVYLEPPTTLLVDTKPLPLRRESTLTARRYPQATCEDNRPRNYPVNDFPVDDDPFLPWVHDYFMTDQAVVFVAQNRRRCQTGEGKTGNMKFMEPQMALFQPVAVTTDENGRFRLDAKVGQHTRFLCRFHKGEASSASTITFSTYSIPYEYVNWRKHQGDFMFRTEGSDVHHFEFSQLIFSCPLPKFRPAFVDVVPIRTPARRGAWMLSENEVGPQYAHELRKSGQFFNASVDYGDSHVLPNTEASGRIANIPLCTENKSSSGSQTNSVEKQHQLVLCTWTSASYNRRGDQTTIGDAGLRLREWIIFHQLVGVDHIYVYDNSQHANQTLANVAREFPAFVTYHSWPASVCSNNRPNHKNPGERSSQYAAEASCRERYGWHTSWMSFLDVDEYIVPSRKETWREFLSSVSSDTKVLKMRSSRGRPRAKLMELMADQTKCGAASARKPRFPLDPCLVPRSNETFLRVYNCEYIRPPRPDRFARAMKQIYRPEFVLSHFVHYSTITKDIARFYSNYSHPKSYQRRVKASEWGDVFLNELTEGLLVHTKSVLPAETRGRGANCVNGKPARGCSVGYVCPASVPFNDASHPNNPFKDMEGKFCNCWINEHTENYWIPRLETELSRSP